MLLPSLRQNTHTTLRLKSKSRTPWLTALVDGLSRCKKLQTHYTRTHLNTPHAASMGRAECTEQMEAHLDFNRRSVKTMMKSEGTLSASERPQTFQVAGVYGIPPYE